jgi:hypothetical protein
VPFFPVQIAPGSRWRTRSRQIITLIQLVSLLATAWMIWRVSWVPQLHRQTLGSLLGHVLGYTLLAWAWSAIVATGLYAILPIEDRTEMIPEVLRTAATAVWFGPAMILLSEFSPAALLAALVLVVYASRLLYAQWMPKLSPSPRPYIARVPGEFADCQLPQAFVWRERLPALAVALCLEAGVIAVATHYPLLGAAWLCMGTAFLTVFSMSTGAADAGRPPTLPKSILGILATVVLAALLTMGRGFGHGGAGGLGLPGERAGDQRPTLVETARAVLRQLFYGETPLGPRGTGDTASTPKQPNQPNTGAMGGFPGVILWPEMKPVVTLVAPVPRSGNTLVPGKPTQPLSIPFAGEYWMFRWPLAKPPSTSFSQRGTPWKLSFSSTDHAPLQMKAIQKLDTPIDIRCCRAIQVDIVNADRYPGTVEVELDLLNTEAGRYQSLFLGTKPVQSRPDLSRDPVMPVRETLEFAVPSNPSLEEFNQFQVVFLRARVRADKSAKVSLERFLLLPR